ncbi:hypothetical protein N657DRAFT_180375 [Parathielavia appendiculata]|uniref:Uncharacterized protein n=1 Tax=Parathielavia appendiculata TaxID=2587402 RepID=A0AAN6Z6J1_9PEZI|nr:hypothetical protein N657DRAFT_180375 [Parathielavia appendiculata]
MQHGPASGTAEACARTCMKLQKGVTLELLGPRRFCHMREGSLAHDSLHHLSREYGLASRPAQAICKDTAKTHRCRCKSSQERDTDAQHSPDGFSVPEFTKPVYVVLSSHLEGNQDKLMIYPKACHGIPSLLLHKAPISDELGLRVGGLQQHKGGHVSRQLKHDIDHPYRRLCWRQAARRLRIAVWKKTASFTP